MSSGSRSVGSSPRQRMRNVLSGATALLLAVSTLSFASPASAAPTPVYEITGQWMQGTPTPVAPGDVVTAEWRVNVNDAQQAPSNDPVDNVTFTAVASGALFQQLPDLCLVDGVSPASSISDDGRTLVCNTGTQQMGTAVVIQSPVLVDAANGEPADDLCNVRTVAEDLNLPLISSAAEAGSLLMNPDKPALTKREYAVLNALVRSGATADIAAELFVSANTVKTQLRSLYRKLGARNRDEALTIAANRYLIDSLPGGSDHDMA